MAEKVRNDLGTKLSGCEMTRTGYHLMSIFSSGFGTTPVKEVKGSPIAQ